MQKEAKTSSPSNEPAILVVGGDVAHQRMYAETIGRACQIRVVQAFNGQQALEAAARSDLVCALIDSTVPDSDCVELAQLIRGQRHPEITPLIFIVGEDAEPGFLQRCYLLGAADVLMPRPNPQILVQKVRVYIELFHRHRQLRSEVQNAEDRNQELAEENREFLRIRELLVRRATHDALTKLPNRALFADRLNVAASRGRRSREPLAVAFVDLDQFKSVNDEHGHATGDAVLRTIAQRLTSTLRTSDTIARLGGDEFGIVLEEMTLESVARLAQKIHATVCKPVTLESALRGTRVRLQVGASIGIAVLRQQDTDLQDLVNRADRMMYAAKAAGGGIRMDFSERRRRADNRVRPLRERRHEANAGIGEKTLSETPSRHRKSSRAPRSGR